MRLLHSTVSALAVVTMLSACATTNTRGVAAEAKTQAEQSLPDTPFTWKAAQDKIGDVEVAWVDRIRDKTLSRLVGEAQENNRDLQAAAANVERAQALAKQAGAALSPQLGLSAGGGGSGNLDGASGGNLNIGVQASWELDIWGKLRSGQQAAYQSAQAAEADYTYAQHSLAAGVARAYFIAIEANRQEALAQKIVEAVGETQRIVQLQYDNGLANQQDLSLVKSDAASSRDSLLAAQGGKRDALRALELLLGRYPGADIEVRKSLPNVPRAPGAGIPSEILERRPDLVAAERRIAASINGVNQAKAAKLPSISLSGSFGGSSSGLSSLLNPANLAWQAASSLLVPIIDGGARNAQIDVATAEQKAAVAAYAQAGLTAFGEVESALDGGVVLRQRSEALNESVIEAEKALKVAQLRFDEGESDLLDVLTIQQRLFGAEANQIAIERAQLDQFVALNLALGGDWR